MAMSSCGGPDTHRIPLSAAVGAAERSVDGKHETVLISQGTARTVVLWFNQRCKLSGRICGAAGNGWSPYLQPPGLSLPPSPGVPGRGTYRKVPGGRQVVYQDYPLYERSRVAKQAPGWEPAFPLMD